MKFEKPRFEHMWIVHQRSKYTSAVDKYWYFDKEQEARGFYESMCRGWKICRNTDDDHEYLEEASNPSAAYDVFVRGGFLPLGEGDFLTLKKGVDFFSNLHGTNKVGPCTFLNYLTWVINRLL